MSHQAKGRTLFPFLLLLAGVVFSVANVLVLLVTVKGSVNVPLAVDLYRVCPPCVLYFAGAPLIVAVLHVLLFHQAMRSSRRDFGDPAATAAAPAASANQVEATGDTTTGALVILGLLQREGRFLDFLAEDLSPYSDAQIGAAVRAIHAGCRKALQGRVELDRVLSGDEGQDVTVPDGFDPAEVRLTGSVPNHGPYRGTLQHPGWRVRKLELPAVTDTAHLGILAPAEVELSAPSASTRV